MISRKAVNGQTLRVLVVFVICIRSQYITRMTEYIC